MKLWATIAKDIKILLRDKIGLTLMFGMPLVLVIVVTTIQNGTFDLNNKTKMSLVVYNKDTGRLSRQFIQTVNGMGMFKLIEIRNAGKEKKEKEIKEDIRSNDAVVGIVIPQTFSMRLASKAKSVSDKALKSFGLEADTLKVDSGNLHELTFYYSPIVQQSLKSSILRLLKSSLQIMESRQVLRNLYFSINEKTMPDSVENDMLNTNLSVSEVPLVDGAEKPVLNATQHNVPAWTIFAMFFVVMSLGSSIVREKLSGSFIRLKTLPTPYFIAILSKQITYLTVTLLQAVMIFAIGIWVFPNIGLPALHLPEDITGLLLVTLVCGWCAVSYAICIGVFAQTQEQANGFGAVSIVILAILGGIMVPDFIMPESIRAVMAVSPLYWCLQAFYRLFLEGGKLNDVLIDVFILLSITLTLQLIAFAGLKRKKFI